MSSLNKAMIIGRLGQDVKLNHTKTGMAVGNFTVATVGYGKEDPTEWHKIVVWDKLAENCAKYLSKGKLCYVEGRLSTRQYTDKNGAKAYSTEIIAHAVQFLNAKEGNEREEKQQERPTAPPVYDFDSMPF